MTNTPVTTDAKPEDGKICGTSVTIDIVQVLLHLHIVNTLRDNQQFY